MTKTHKTLETIDRGLSIAMKGLDILTVLGCILLTGLVAYFVLMIMGYTGALHIVLTGLIGLLGGLVVNLVLRFFAHLI